MGVGVGVAKGYLGEKRPIPYSRQEVSNPSSPHRRFANGRDMASGPMASQGRGFGVAGGQPVGDERVPRRYNSKTRWE